MRLSPDRNAALLGAMMVLFSGPIALSTSDGAKIPPPSRNKEQADTKVVEIVVTGVGLDPEKALRDAFARAVEQAVGVLVDAETSVKSD